MGKVIAIFLFSFSIVLASNSLELTGEYSKQFGNPYRVLLEKKDKKINVFSEDKDIVLKVESNLDKFNFQTKVQHPQEFILKNKTLERVLYNFYAEEFNVYYEKSNSIKANVLSGKIELNYNNVEHQSIPHLNSVAVEVVVEIEKNGQKEVKTIKMDNRLGKNGSNYDWTIRLSLDFSTKQLDSIIKEIIENEVYTIIQ